MTIAVAIHGAAGRMGRQLLQAVHEHATAEVSHAFEQPGSPAIGQDISLLAGGGTQGVLVEDTLQPTSQAFDVIVDFTVPAATLALLDTLAAHQTHASKAIVIGTTGFDEASLLALHEHAKHIPIVFASNYSVGVTLSLQLLKDAATALGDDYDVEITEAHHRHKIDAPSGTALSMGEVVAEALGRDLKTDAIYGREGITGARDTKTIGFSTVRAGDIIGDHTVLFAGNGERLEITHRAVDRMTFARGAIRAACWLKNQPAGLYDMRHVLGIA
jgi:4-hydroxy-tetrahydrodipicolinate reductase